MSPRVVQTTVLTACLMSTAAYAGENKISTAELNDGPCAVHVHLTRPDKSSMAGVWVGVRVANGFGGYDQVGVRTNQDGRAQFLGLPNSGTLRFSVRGRSLRQTDFASADVCGSVAEIVAMDSN